MPARIMAGIVKTNEDAPEEGGRGPVQNSWPEADTQGRGVCRRRRAARTVLVRAAWTVLFGALAWGATLSVRRAVVQALRTSQDFGTCWITTRGLLAGENVYEMKRTNRLSRHIQQLRRGKFAYFDPQYLPSSQVILIPYALLPYKTAVTAWAVTNMAATVAMLGAAYALFGRRCGLRPFFLASLLFLCGGPFRIAVANGQLSIVALAFVVLALWACRGRFYLLSGLCLAFSLLKYHLVLPFLVLFLPDRRRWIALGTCALIHLLWHLALCWQIGASPVGIVWRIVQLNTGVGARHDWFDVRSLARWAAGRFRPDVDPLWFLLPFLVLLAAWLAFLCWRSRKNPDDLAWMSVLAAFGLVATYHRVYDAVVLAFPALWTATGKGAWLRKGLAWLCLAVLTLAFPVLRYEWWKNRLPREALWLWTAPALWVLTVTLLSLFRREPPPESGSELAHRREDHVAAGLVNA